jgi:chromosomal replication initiator protein
MPAPTEATIEEAIWAETLSQLQGQMTKAAFNSVMQGTTLIGLDGEVYVIKVATKLAKEWLENRLRQVVERALSNVIGSAATVEFRL